MQDVYHVCLLIGTALLAAGLFMGHGHDIDHGHESGAFGEALQFINLRNITFFTAFFGLAGTVVAALGASVVPALIAALGAGLFASVFSHKLMKYLRRTESGEELQHDSLAGRTATVIVGATREQRGKISIRINGRILQFPARLSETSQHETAQPGSEVLIVEMSEGTALIVEAELSDRP